MTIHGIGCILNGVLESSLGTPTADNVIFRHYRQQITEVSSTRA